MGLLDNLTGMLGGGGDDKAQGAMGILGSLLQQGGGEGQSGNIVSTLLSGAGAQGGLQGTLETLAANGLSDHVASWLSNNPNIPVSTDQIRDALGSDQVEQMANATGLPVGDFLKHLAEHLPAAASAAAGTSQG